MTDIVNSLTKYAHESPQNTPTVSRVTVDGTNNKLIKFTTTERYGYLIYRDSATTINVLKPANTTTSDDAGTYTHTFTMSAGQIIFGSFGSDSVIGFSTAKADTDWTITIAV